MFQTRDEAGEMLAKRVMHYSGKDTVVLALPRGGVPVAAPIASALRAPLDLMLVRKVGYPGQKELALAAIAGAGGDTLEVNAEIAAASGLDSAEIEQLANQQRAELARRSAVYLAGRAPVPLAQKTVILVDDGIATGATMRAALRALRRAGPRRIVLAVPVAPPDVVAALRDEVDELICLETPPYFNAVGAHYVSFPQVEDAEVIAMLDAAAKPA
jgi:putative phosphoribosyl transferase